MSEAKRDQNRIPTLLAVSSADGTTPIPLYADPITHRLYVDLSGAGSGTVTSVTVATANGFDATVTNPTTAVSISLKTTVTGLLKGNGTAISTATADVDYLTPTTASTTYSSISNPVFTGTGYFPSLKINTSSTAAPLVVDGASFQAIRINGSVNNRLTIVSHDNSNMWNIDSYTGALRIFREDYNSGGSGANGSVKFQLANDGTLTLNGNVSSLNISGTNSGDNATNSQYSGLAASKADVGQTFYIGTTQVAINRTSAGLTLAGLTLTTPDIGTPSAGTLTNCTGLPIAGLTASTSTAIGVGSIELGHASDTTITRVSAGVLAVEGATLPSVSSTSTLTNKRITKRVVTVTQSATPTINTDNTDIASITGLAQAITSMTTNLSGTPVAGDLLMIQITDNGTARAITWGASFQATNISLPTTTVISAMLRILFQWNTTASKWDCIGTA